MVVDKKILKLKNALSLLTNQTLKQIAIKVKNKKRERIIINNFKCESKRKKILFILKT